MDNAERDTLHARTPLFYKPGPRQGFGCVAIGPSLDPRFMGPEVPRVLVCDTVFRLKGHYYLGNPRGEGNRRRSVLLHRVVYAAACGPIPAGCEVHHIDDNPFNNHPDNLEALPKFTHRSEHKSRHRYHCICRVCGKTFGCYQSFGTRCSKECRRKDHARAERERRASL